MNLNKIQIGNKKVMPFTIPSGIIMTNPKCAERILEMCSQIGIWTTKSYTLHPREGNREPILTQYSPGCFGNAVGLTNPGAETARQQIKEANIPKNRVILSSIAGTTEYEFKEITKTLDNVVDAHELNLSCPHINKGGMTIGKHPELVYNITKAVCEVTNKEIFTKLTPNTDKIGEIAKAAVKAGARGISLINTVGPGYYEHKNQPILTNILGGMSGKGILPLGLKCAREIRQVIGPEIPIIGMGGISTSKDAISYFQFTNAVGIGSALAGLTDEEIRDYFIALVEDIKYGLDRAPSFLKNINMKYKKVKIKEKIDCADDFKIFKTNNNLNASAGQFIFAWLPKTGEKPFSIMDNNPLTLGVLTRGHFTRKFNSLTQEDDFYIRGPYGQEVDVPKGNRVIIVGGGCGIAGINLLAKRVYKKTSLTTLLGAKDKEHLFGINEFKKYGCIRIATENGSLGIKGLVTDLFKQKLGDLRKGTYFFNCGPKKMIDSILPIELRFSSPERIYSSLDYITSCGIGICGKCTDEKGRRTCIYGPFVQAD
jgi:dihydroorotate dehydrogenase (NAD+) catalytic subunit